MEYYFHIIFIRNTLTYFQRIIIALDFFDPSGYLEKTVKSLQTFVLFSTHQLTSIAALFPDINGSSPWTL